MGDVSQEGLRWDRSCPEALGEAAQPPASPLGQFSTNQPLFPLAPPDSPQSKTHALNHNRRSLECSRSKTKASRSPRITPDPDVKQPRGASGPKRSYSEGRRTSTAGHAPRSVRKSVPKNRANVSKYKSTVLQQKSTRFTFLPCCQQRLGLGLAEKNAQLKVQTLRFAPPASPQQGCRIHPL